MIFDFVGASNQLDDRSLADPADRAFRFNLHFVPISTAIPGALVGLLNVYIFNFCQKFPIRIGI